MSIEDIEGLCRHTSPNMGKETTNRITHRVKAPFTSIIGNPERGFHPAVNADAWEAAKEEQGQPITEDRAARIGTPQHLIKRSEVTQLSRIRARVQNRAAQLGLIKPAPLILRAASQADETNNQVQP